MALNLQNPQTLLDSHHRQLSQASCTPLMGPQHSLSILLPGGVTRLGSFPADRVECCILQLRPKRLCSSKATPVTAGKQMCLLAYVNYTSGFL